METKGITCKIPLDLHERISEEMRELEMTVSQYMEMIIREHLEGGSSMSKTRTMAFQVSEELFQKIKDYLEHYEQTYRRKLTQKQFVIGLIEQTLEEAEDDFAAYQAEEGGEAAETPETEDTPAGEGENAWDEGTGGFEAHSEEPEPDSESEDEPESDSDEEPEDYTEPEESAENEDEPYYA